MTIKTYFYLHFSGKVYRKDVPSDQFTLIPQGFHRIAAQSNQIIELTHNGCGITVKNRHGAIQYFTNEEMTMIALQSESM